MSMIPISAEFHAGGKFVHRLYEHRILGACVFLCAKQAARSRGWCGVIIWNFVVTKKLI